MLDYRPVRSACLNQHVPGDPLLAGQRPDSMISFGNLARRVETATFSHIIIQWAREKEPEWCTKWWLLYFCVILSLISVCKCTTTCPSHFNQMWMQLRVSVLQYAGKLKQTEKRYRGACYKHLHSSSHLILYYASSRNTRPDIYFQICITHQYRQNVRMNGCMMPAPGLLWTPVFVWSTCETGELQWNKEEGHAVLKNTMLQLQMHLGDALQMFRCVGEGDQSSIKCKPFTSLPKIPIILQQVAKLLTRRPQLGVKHRLCFV